MENLLSLLESVYAAWLGPSGTAWAKDITLGVLCGLGLFLLLHSYLERYLLSPSLNKNDVRKIQMPMTFQSRFKEQTGTDSSTDPKACRHDATKQKEKEKPRSPVEDMSPDHHLNSLENIWKSPSTTEDNTKLPSFGEIREKSEQETAAQKLSYPNSCRKQFPLKYNQLFWGLPTLHSESLVATAWIPQGSSILPSPFILFNVISTVYPVPVQGNMSEVLCQAHPLSILEVKFPPLIQSPLCFHHQPLNQAQSHRAHFEPSLPAILLSLLPHSKDSGTLSFRSSEKTQCPPTDIQHREKTSFKKQLETGLALPWMVQRPQEVYDVLEPNLHQDWAGSVLPENFPVSPELRQNLEQHIQKWLIQHQCSLPERKQEALKLMQLRKNLTDACHDRDQPGLSSSFATWNEHSNTDQKRRLQSEEEDDKSLGDPSTSSDKTPVNDSGAKHAESGRNWMTNLKSDLGNDSVKWKYKNPVGMTKDHLERKSEQIKHGLIPLSVRRSWLAMNRGFSLCDTHMESRNLGLEKNSEISKSSSERLAFVDTGTQQALEDHVVRLWVRHKWGLPLKVIKPVNILLMQNTEPFPIVLCPHPSSAPGLSTTASAVEGGSFLENTYLGELVMKNSSLGLGNLILISTPSCKEMERAPVEIPSDTEHQISQALPTIPDSKKPSKTVRFGNVGTPSQTASILAAKRENRGNQDLEATRLQADGSQFSHRVQKESAEQPEVFATAGLHADASRKTRLDAQPLPSPLFCDRVVRDKGNSLRQRKPSDTKDQVSEIGQRKVLTWPYQTEDTNRQRKEEREEKSKFIPVWENENNFRNKCQQPPQGTTQSHSKNPFQKFVTQLLGWIRPKEKNKRQEKPLLKGAQPLSTAQCQRQVKNKPYVDGNIAESRELLTEGRQMSAKERMPQYKLCPSNFNQHREAPATSYGHRPPAYSEQRRPLVSTASASCQRCSTLEKKFRDLQSLKNEHHYNKPQTKQSSGMFPPRDL